MKTSLEKTSQLGRKLNFEIPAEKVSSTFSKVYKGLQKNANIKGFRKGKAPLDMIKKMFSDRVKQDVLEDLVSEAYSNALSEHTLRPVSEPKVNFELLNENKEFKFTAEFEIRPEVQLKKITKLKVEKEKLEISDEQVDTVINQIRESKPTYTPVFEDRPAKKGDVVEIDFSGFIDNQPLQGGSGTGHKLELGANAFIPGFEDGLIGATIGAQKTLNLQFPADYGHKEIAGKPVRFSVTVKAILKKELPALTDDFVKELGGYKTVDELKELIKKDLLEQESSRIKDDLRNKVLRALVEANPVDVPESLQQQQKDFLIDDVKKRMQQQGMDEAGFKEYTQKWDKDFTETASFMIQSSFLIETIADQQKLSATAEEFEERLKKYSQQANIDLKSIYEFYKTNPDRRHQVKYQITEEKVVDYLIKNAELIEVPKKTK